MHVAKFEIDSSNLDQIVNHLIEFIDFDYENHSTDMSVLASEDRNFTNSSSQFNLIILKVSNSRLFIEVVGAAGGTGLLNIDWGSEKGFIKKVEKQLADYATEFGLVLEKIDDDY